MLILSQFGKRFSQMCPKAKYDTTPAWLSLIFMTLVQDLIVDFLTPEFFRVKHCRLA